MGVRSGKGCVKIRTCKDRENLRGSRIGERFYGMPAFLGTVKRDITKEMPPTGTNV